ncbi:MAG: NADH-quinone oxidoreductase subunit NuoE [Hydrogenobaculum sp.]
MLTQEIKEAIDGHIKYFGSKEEALLLSLHSIQEHLGHIPEEALEELSEILDIPLHHIKGVVAFYEMFDTGEKAKHRIYVCNSIVCYLLKSHKVFNAVKELLGIEPGQVTRDGMFKLVEVQCLGACSEAPVFMIDNDIYKYESKEKLHEILAKYS